MQTYNSLQMLNISKISRREHGSILLIYAHHQLTCCHVTVWYIIKPVFQEWEHTGYLILDDGFKAHVSHNIDYPSK